jgi:hypothetical protein
VDEGHHGRGLRIPRDGAECGASGETDASRQRDQPDRQRKSKTLRAHVRCWLLRLISFGPIR